MSGQGNGLIHEREFNAAIAALASQLSNHQREMLARLDGLQETQVETLGEARKTNGRVNELERRAAVTDVRLVTVEREIKGLKGPGVTDGKSGRSGEPVTVRDVWIFGLALGVVGAAVKWLPALFRAAHLGGQP